jgi:hypothetical protein
VTTAHNTSSAARSVLARRSPNELIPYSVVRDLGPRAEHYRGVIPIEVKAIVGSLNRHSDFDQNFRPKREHLSDRWEKMQRLQQKGHAFPAIEVIQVGGIYFVKDGHHRVSIARAAGAAFIDAVVTEVEVNNPPRVDDVVTEHSHEMTAANSWRPQALLERLLHPTRGRAVAHA